jgi:raffinose/stachyose/melibiose transport system substrate-binding protein
MKRYIQLFLVSCFVFVLFTGCKGKQEEGSAGGQTITLTMGVWSDLLMGPTGGGLLQTITEKWLSEHPNVRLEIDTMGDTGEFINKIKVLAATRTVPDLMFNWVGTAIEPLVTSGTVRDVTNDVSSDPDWVDNFAPGAIDASYYKDGKLYILPWEKTILGYYYNTSLFKENGLELPRTYDEFLHCVDVFKSQGIIPWIIGAKDDWSLSWMIDDFYVRYDDDLEYVWKVVDGTAKFADNKEMLKGVNKLTELYKRGAFPQNISSLPFEQAKELFYEKKAAMISCGTWLMSEMIAHNLSKEYIDQLDFKPFPAFTDSSYPQNTISQNYAAGVCISSSLAGEKLALALDWMKFWSSEFTAREFNKAQYFSTFSLMPNPGESNSIFMKIMQTGQDYNGFMHSYYIYPASFQAPYYRATVELTTGAISGQQFLSRLDEILAESREGN